MKKLIAILLAVLMVCTLFVGCAKKDAAPETETPAVEGEESLKDKYGFDKLDMICFNGGNVGMWDELVELFLEYYPGVEVTTDFSDDVANRVRSRMMTETPPDFIVSSGPEWSLNDAISAGQIMDLSDFYATGTNADGVPLTEVLPKSSLASCNVYGVQAALPSGTTYLGWWYNVGMFEELGITPPTNWDELYAAAEVLKANDIIPFMYQETSYGYWGLSMEMMAVAGGMDLFNATYVTLEEGAWTSEGALKAIKAQEALVKDGILSPLSVGADFAASQVDFVNGRIAMLPNGTWFENEMKDVLPEGFDMAFIPFPALEEGGPRAVVVTGGGTGNIPNHCLNPEAAKAFLGVMLTDKGQAIIAKYGQMPISQIIDTSILSDIMTPANLSALQAAQQDDVLVLTSTETNYHDVNMAVKESNDYLCLGDMTAEEYCQTVEEAAEAVRNDPETIFFEAQ